MFFSSETEWESSIEPNGELFYIESHIDTFSERKRIEEEESSFPTLELTRRRSMRAGKLMRLIKRKGSTRGSVRNKKLNVAESVSTDRRKPETISEEYVYSDYQVIKIKFCLYNLHDFQKQY